VKIVNSRSKEKRREVCTSNPGTEEEANDQLEINLMDSKEEEVFHERMQMPRTG